MEKNRSNEKGVDPIQRTHCWTSPTKEGRVFTHANTHTHKHKHNFEHTYAHTNTHQTSNITTYVITHSDINSILGFRKEVFDFTFHDIFPRDGSIIGAAR
eukprot:m.193808 g.193808  ORF g.193808 m.193808 type:complete len:100 (-) comp32518_c1_seq4:19-318(-)